jgi:hypothetical protein
MKTGSTSAKLWAAFAFTAIGSALARALAEVYPGQAVLRMSNWNLLEAAAQAIAVYFCLKVRRDQGPGSAMRAAWLLVAVSSSFAVLRQIFEFVSVAAGWNRSTPEIMNLRMIPITLELTLLAAGLAIMLRSFVSLGLGVRLRWTDVLWLVVVIAMVPPVLSMRGNLSAAQSIQTVLRDLQTLSPALMAAAALFGILLHRVAQDMEGGDLAGSLRLIVAYLMCRMLGMVVRSWPDVYNNFAVSLVLLGIARGGTWLFTLSVARRWRMTQKANQLSKSFAQAQ